MEATFQPEIVGCPVIAYRVDKSYSRARSDTAYAVLYRRGVASDPFVSCVLTKDSVKAGEWIAGRYFRTEGEALADFATRAELNPLTF